MSFVHLIFGCIQEPTIFRCQPVAPVTAPDAPLPIVLDDWYKDAEALLKKLSGYPLLVIPDKQTFQVIRNITLVCQAVDLMEGLPVPLSFLRELKELFGARFDVVHFTTEAADDNKSMIELYHWKQSLGELLPELHFVKAESVEEGVVQYLAVHSVDWMMVFPKKHALLEFHKSRSKRIVMHSHVPVLSICEKVGASTKEKTIV